MEDLGSIRGYYDAQRDSSYYSLVLGVGSGAVINTSLHLPGAGPFDLRGLGLTIGSNARRLKWTADTVPVTLLLDDSLSLYPVLLRIGRLDTSGPYATVQVTVVLTRAALFALLRADHAVLSWPTMRLPLNRN